ncbi:MAG TPA: SRPBCC domain-containing protein [Asticcacaulis sp.]
MTEAREFSVSRRLEAPPERVWRAFTDADALAAWWGPHGVSATARLDVREGGAFEIVMRGADGVAYPIEGSYLSVEAPRLLVMEMSLENHPANWRDYLAELFTRAGGAPEELAQVRVVTRVTLTPEAGGTRLDIAQVYESEALRDAFAGMGNAEGWAQSLDKLQRALA